MWALHSHSVHFVWTSISCLNWPFLYMYAESLELYLTLCDPMDYSPPASSVHGILQARILEWVAIPFSRGSFQPRGWTQVLCIEGRFFTIWATKEAQEVGKYHGSLLSAQQVVGAGKSMYIQKPWHQQFGAVQWSIADGDFFCLNNPMR